MRDKQQTASTVASPTAYVYGRRMLGVRNEVQATTSLFATAHAMPCYVHRSARGRGHSGCSRQGAKEDEEEQEQEAPAYDDIPASRDGLLERVLLFCGDAKKKRKEQD